MINPLDSPNPKKLKNQKLKPLIFFVNTRISVIFFQKKSKQQYYFSRKIQTITKLFWILVFSFMYLVSVDPTDRSLVSCKDIWIFWAKS